MRYRASKKVSRRCWRQQDPHQKQYVPLPFGGGHNNWSSLWYIFSYLSVDLAAKAMFYCAGVKELEFGFLYLVV